MVACRSIRRFARFRDAFMGLLRFIRLMLALLALGSAMAGSAAASLAMAARAMPCHEAGMADVPAMFAAPMASHAGMGVETKPLAMTASAVATGGQMLHPPGPDGSPLHLCCVLSQLVAMPLAAPALRLPEPHVAALALPEGEMLRGLSLATPVPPPRSI